MWNFFLMFWCKKGLEKGLVWYGKKLLDNIQADHISLEENVKEAQPRSIVSLTAICSYTRAHFPCPIESTVKQNTKRFWIWRKIKLTQFPLNISHAHTVHKLQGDLLNISWILLGTTQAIGSMLSFLGVEHSKEYLCVTNYSNTKRKEWVQNY